MSIDDKSGMERRTSLILLQYWNGLRDERPFPKENEIDPDQLSMVWGHCFVIQLRDIKKVRDYNYTYFGPNLVRAYQDGTLDRFNGKMISPDANRTALLFEEVIKQGDPVLDEGEYVNPIGKVVKFRQSLMPLGDDKGKAVFSILGGAWFKLFEQ